MTDLAFKLLGSLRDQGPQTARVVKKAARCCIRRANGTLQGAWLAGLVEYDPSDTEPQPGLRRYQITDLGRAELAAMGAGWADDDTDEEDG